MERLLVSDINGGWKLIRQNKEEGYAQELIKHSNRSHHLICFTVLHECAVS